MSPRRNGLGQLDLALTSQSMDFLLWDSNLSPQATTSTTSKAMTKGEEWPREAVEILQHWHAILSSRGKSGRGKVFQPVAAILNASNCPFGAPAVMAKWQSMQKSKAAQARMQTTAAREQGLHQRNAEEALANAVAMQQEACTARRAEEETDFGRMDGSMDGATCTGEDTSRGHAVLGATKKRVEMVADNVRIATIEIRNVERMRTG